MEVIISNAANEAVDMGIAATDYMNTEQGIQYAISYVEREKGITFNGVWRDYIRRHICTAIGA